MKSTTHNPLLKEKKEFLERQSQEYRNALKGEVQELKAKSEDIGKKALVAGGAILLTYALAKVFMGGKNEPEPQKLLPYKSKKKKNKHYTDTFTAYEDLSGNASAFDVTDVPFTETVEPAEPKYVPVAPQKTEQSNVAKDIFAVVAQQITAYLIILGTRKLEEYLNARQHDADTPSTETADQQFGDTYVSPGAANIQSALAE